MNSLGFEFALDDEIRFGEALVDIAEIELDPLGDVRSLRRVTMAASCLARNSRSNSAQNSAGGRSARFTFSKSSSETVCFF